MFGPVAVLGLLGVAAAGDDVNCEPAIAELIEGRELAGGTGGATNPGRCAKIKPSRSVTEAACAPTKNPSGASEK